MLRYVKGDVTQPISDGVIAHVCNDIGVMGAGVALAIRNKYPDAYRAYYQEFTTHGLFLGTNILVQLPGITIANMIAQRGIRSAGNPTPLRYDALIKCLAMLPAETIHMPMIGSGLAGGDWSVIEELIKQYVDDAVVYRFTSG